MSIVANCKISVIIPTFNEASYIQNCIKSLLKQTYKNLELIVVDDGSTDSTVTKILELKLKKNFMLLRKTHSGSGASRNYGVCKSSGEIIMFLDADMMFQRTFIEKLAKPIIERKTIGTVPEKELLANPQNYWALCWNIGRFSAARDNSKRYMKYMNINLKDEGGIYRAICRKEFLKVGGFEEGGDYTDDTSLARKLGRKSLLVKNAVLYHFNPSSLAEVWKRASWIGSGKDFRKTPHGKMINLIRFSLPFAALKGFMIGLRYNYLQFMFFKIVYDTSIWLSLLKAKEK